MKEKQVRFSVSCTYTDSKSARAPTLSSRRIIYRPELSMEVMILVSPFDSESTDQKPEDQAFLQHVN